MEYEFSRLETLEPEGGRTWPLLTVGGLLLLVFGAASIYLIQSSMLVQHRIELRAGWTIALGEARERLSEGGPRSRLEDGRERLLFDKATVGQILQVRREILERADPGQSMVDRLDSLHLVTFRFNTLLSDTDSAASLATLRADLSSQIQRVLDDLRSLSAHATLELGGKWYLLNGLASLSIILAGLTLFLVRAMVLRGRKLQIALDWVKRIATRDELTGLWNRRAIFPILNRELSRCEREKKAISVLMVDFDHFKTINDRFGHQAGDAVLREGAQRMLKILRPYDSIGRYGGEEIIILLPGCESKEALMVGERLAETIRSSPFAYGEERITATVSVGGATKESPTRGHADRMVVSADQYLYEAKTAGRNCVVTGPSLSYDGEVSETGA
ncbi:MAG: GGDEF domain-containing protein [Pseudomonadota bacterium]